MKTLSKAIAASALALGASHAMAYELGGGFDASANVGVVSDYMWRGITQTRNGAALQGGVDLTYAINDSSSLYLGTWGSNINFDLAPQADTEQDFYAGYGFTVGDFSFDLKRTEYHYASAKSLNFGETHAHVKWAFTEGQAVTAGIDYSSDTPVAESDSAVHYYGAYEYALPYEVTFTGTLGQYDYKDAGWVGGDDSKYSYFNLALNKTMWGINFGLAYTGSNIDQSNCQVFMGDNDYCENVVVVSAVKTFK